MKRNFSLFPMAALFIFQTAPASSEIFHLKDGQTIQGQIQRESSDFFVVEINGVKTILLKSRLASGETSTTGSLSGENPEGRILPVSREAVPDREMVSVRQVREAAPAYTNEIESRFKNIANEMIAGLRDSAARMDGKFDARVPRWRNEFKEIVDSPFAGIWADDAQYLISTLNRTDPKLEINDLEELSQKFPEMHIEEWTKENLGSLLPKNVDKCSIQTYLCALYIQTGEKTNLKGACEEGIKHCPDKADFFKVILGMGEKNR